MQLVVNRGKAKGQFVTVAGPHFLIGRGPECQLRPLSDEVSRRHAELKIIAGMAVIVDLGSTSGTRVNGQALTGPASLRTGDVIEIGPLSFTVLLDDGRPPERPKRSAEDQVSSWLGDEDDGHVEAVASSQSRHAVRTAAGGLPREGDHSSSTATARRPAEDAGEDAFALLKSMATRADWPA
jgi:pSer/pThr/pTyr-binding forkhead associated (FHA) protein